MLSLSEGFRDFLLFEQRGLNVSNEVEIQDLPKKVLKLLKLIESGSSVVKTVRDYKKMKLGGGYMMLYNALHAKTLWAWDFCPVFILLAKYGDRFLGISLHYIPYALRVSLAEKLIKMTSWEKRIKYPDIKAAFKASKLPIGILALCLRMYRIDRIASEVKEFDSMSFMDAIRNIMPKFRKKDEQAVYKIIMSKFYKQSGGIRGATWDKKKKK